LVLTNKLFNLMPYLSKSGLLKVQKLKLTNIPKHRIWYHKRSLNHGIFAVTKMHSGWLIDQESQDSKSKIPSIVQNYLNTAFY
jgi:hypothetical protein